MPANGSLGNQIARLALKLLLQVIRTLSSRRVTPDSASDGWMDGWIEHAPFKSIKNN